MIISGYFIVGICLAGLFWTASEHERLSTRRAVYVSLVVAWPLIVGTIGGIIGYELGLKLLEEHRFWTNKKNIASLGDECTKWMEKNRRKDG